jgi:hypothetical protein
MEDVFRAAAPFDGLLCESSFGSAPQDGRWWTISLNEYITRFPDPGSELLTRAAAAFVGPVPAIIGSIGNWPIVWKSEDAVYMRWLSSTFRGDLGGGVEQFQHKIDWGLPGADPDLSEAAALTFAELLATKWQALFGMDPGFGNMFSTDVRYLEVGVTQKTQTSGTAADGTGGNLEQDFDTQWYSYPLGARPQGVYSGPSLPYEVACALTLQTNKRGPSGRGRMYLPPFGVNSMTNGGRYAATTSTGAGQFVGIFLGSVVAASPHVPVVVSRRRIILTEITQLLAGAVPDSQRRRRRSQDEARVVAWNG